MTSEFFGNLYEKEKMKFDIIYKLFVDKTCHLLKLIGANINTVPVLDIRSKRMLVTLSAIVLSLKTKNTISKIGDLCIKLFHENCNWHSY